MGILRQKNGNPTKAKRAGAKPAAASPRAGSGNAVKQEPAGPTLGELPAVSEAQPQFTGERRRGPPRSRAAAGSGSGKKAKSDSQRDSNDAENTPTRTAKLVPTNAVHPTERRIKRRMHKNGALMAAAGAALLGALILSNQSEPPELVLGDRQTASRLPTGRDWQSDAAPDADYRATHRGGNADTQFSALGPLGLQQDNIQKPELATQTRPAASKNGLTTGDIAEMERLLSRLDLATGVPDGVIDDDTEQAIRLYQEFAGLHVDGEASRHLLADMREVVKILDSEN